MNMVHTSIGHENGWTEMYYHATCVAKYCNEKVIEENKIPIMRTRVILNTGGYFTKTTKKRMNQFAEMFGLGFRVSQVKGDWRADIDKEISSTFLGYTFDGNTCEFTVSK